MKDFDASLLQYMDSAGSYLLVANYIGLDSGDAPGSQYGTRASEWGPVAVAYIAVQGYLCGDVVDEVIMDEAISDVVNGREHVAMDLVEYGPCIGIGPGELRELLHADDIDAAVEALNVREHGMGL